jgi:hypothetical protein
LGKEIEKEVKKVMNVNVEVEVEAEIEDKDMSPIRNKIYH